MNFTEQALVFKCADEELLGIVTLPEAPKTIGVLIVVGGPQYRVGSHRQFLLLSRALACASFVSLRFDYRGMGDSVGEQRDFESINDDVSAAVDALLASCPSLKKVVLWGVCDAASASLAYWHSTRDERIGGVALLNPWIRSEATLARTQIRHYYGKRLLAPDFWRKLLTGGVNPWKIAGDFINSLRLAKTADKSSAYTSRLPFHQKMLEALKQYPGDTLLILSGNDYTAKEFIDCVTDDPDWFGILERPTLNRHDLPAADHTFSSALLRTEVEHVTISWLNSIQNSKCR